LFTDIHYFLSHQSNILIVEKPIKKLFYCYHFCSNYLKIQNANLEKKFYSRKDKFDPPNSVTKFNLKCLQPQWKLNTSVNVGNPYYVYKQCKQKMSILIKVIRNSKCIFDLVSNHFRFLYRTCQILALFCTCQSYILIFNF
jgi:hypothetical protein